MNPSIQIAFAFVFGLSFIAVLITLAIRFPNPTPFQYGVFRSVLALAAAGVGAMIPGFIDVSINPSAALVLRAGGALAVFAVVYFWNPAHLVASVPAIGAAGIVAAEQETTIPVVSRSKLAGGEGAAAHTEASDAKLQVGPRLRLASLRLADEQSIRDTIQRFGRNWRDCSIEWPPSLKELVQAMKDGLMTIDQDSIRREAGANVFASDAPGAIETAERARTRAAALIPGLVARSRQLEDDQLVLALRSFLLYSNYMAHSQLAHLATWDGLGRRAISVPQEWRLIGTPDAKRVGLASILGYRNAEKGLANGRLVSINGAYVWGVGGGPGVYLCAPQELFEKPNFPSFEICRWLVPQIEYHSNDVKSLPQEYPLSGWVFDKVVDPNGKEL